MRFYISDPHFYHENLNTKMDNRGFESVEAMNEHMITQWNKKVRKNDEVVILGDFSIEKGEKTNEILHRLNGKKYLIIGNHDRYLKDKKLVFCKTKDAYNYKKRHLQLHISMQRKCL